MASRTGTLWAIAASVAALGALGVGLRQAVRSPLYSVKAVEVELDAGPGSPPLPLTTDQVRELAAVPVGRESLFGLSLRGLESRLLAEPWIRSAALRKRFPSTLEIKVVFRRAVALWVSPDRSLRYVDEEGSAFAPVTLGKASDLPVLAGVPERELARTVTFLKAWEALDVSRHAEVAEAAWFADYGLRALLVTRTAELGAPMRLTLEMGQRFDSQIEGKLEHLARVFEYAALHSLDLKGVRIGDDRRIVVRTARDT